MEPYKHWGIIIKSLEFVKKKIKKFNFVRKFTLRGVTTHLNNLINDKNLEILNLL